MGGRVGLPLPPGGGALVPRCPSKCWVHNNDRNNTGKIGITRQKAKTERQKK